MELLLDWARQDISWTIRVNNIGTSELIRSMNETSSIIKHRAIINLALSVQKSKMSEEEDLAVLIYKSSKTAKARAAAAAVKEKGRMKASSMGRQTSTQKRSFADQDDEASMDRPGKKTAKQGAKKKKRCSSKGCTNQVVQGGVCRRHGAKVKLCKSRGCQNISIQGEVCIRHGAKRKLCSSAECTNRSLKGGVCRRHGAELKLCSSEGCTNIVIKGGVCVKHGAKKKTCSIEGC